MTHTTQDKRAVMSDLGAMARHFVELTERITTLIELNGNSADDAARLQIALTSAKRGATLAESLEEQLRQEKRIISVLVVEDECFIADDIHHWLDQAGFEVLGPAANFERAMSLADARRPDVAIVDINLGAGPDFKLAHRLNELGVPFAFSTGYEARIVPTELAEVPRLEKPLCSARLLQAVSALAAGAAT